VCYKHGVGFVLIRCLRFWFLAMFQVYLAAAVCCACRVSLFCTKGVRQSKFSSDRLELLFSFQPCSQTWIFLSFPQVFLHQPHLTFTTVTSGLQHRQVLRTTTVYTLSTSYPRVVLLSTGRLHRILMISIHFPTRRHMVSGFFRWRSPLLAHRHVDRASGIRDLPDPTHGLWQKGSGHSLG